MPTFPRLFYGGPSPEVRTALATLLKLDVSARDKVKQAVKDVGFPFRRSRLREKAKQLHSELKIVDEGALMAAMDGLADLVRLPSAFLADFVVEVVKDTDSSSQDLESMVKEIASDPGIVEQQAIAEFKELAVPELGRVEYVCGVRARFNKKFNYFEDKIETYTPEVADLHPFVVLRLYLDSPDRPAVFQLDEDRLDRLIAELLAAQRELKIVTRQSARGKGNAGGQQE